MVLAVLRGGAVLAAVVENGLELVVVGAAGVELGVQDKSGGRLVFGSGAWFASCGR